MSTARRATVAPAAPQSWSPDLFRSGTTLATALVLAVLTAWVGSRYFNTIWKMGPLTDLPLHAELLRRSVESGQQLGYTVYYALLDLVSGQRLDDASLRSATTTILTAAVTLRCVLTYVALSLAPVANWLRVAVTGALMVLMPISIPVGDPMYLGKFTGTIWHNSTTILAMPLCIALYITTCLLLTRDDVPRWLHVLVPALVVACGAAKPNYLLAFVPAVFLWCVISLLTSRDKARSFAFLIRRAVPLALAATATLAVMYASTFGGSGITISAQRVGLEVKPLAVWQLLPTTPWWGLASSFALPALATACLRRRGPAVGLAWLTATVGVAQFALLAEVLADGSVLAHANWIWGAHMAMGVLSIVLAMEFVAQWRVLPMWRWAAATVAAYQVALGVWFSYQIWAGNAATRIVFGG